MSGARPGNGDPWWASGRDPDEGIDGGQDPFDAHRQARGAADGGSRSGAPPWVGDVVDVVARFATETSRRMAAGPSARDGGSNAAGGAADESGGPDGRGSTAATGSADGAMPHPPDQVCDACPFCIALRAVREVRPEVLGHLSEAAHHLSLALKAFADAQVDATGGSDDLEHIDLDLE